MNYFKDKNNKVFAYDDEQIEQGYGKGLISLTDEEVQALLNPVETPEQILNEQIQEANAYLKDTDWVKAYELEHKLGINIIPDDSTKWDIINKRQECINIINNINSL